MRFINFIKKLFGYKTLKPIKRRDILDDFNSWNNMKKFNLKDIYND